MWLNSSFVSCWVLFGNVLCCKSRAFMSGEQKSVFSFKELRGSRTCPPPRRHSLFTVVVARCLRQLASLCLLSAMSPNLYQSPGVITSVSSHLNPICHQIRLSCAAPPFTPGFACFCVHASTYIAHKNTLVECIDLYSFFFVILKCSGSYFNPL